MKGLKWKICLIMKGVKLGEGHMDMFIKLEGKMGKLTPYHYLDNAYHVPTLICKVNYI